MNDHQQPPQSRKNYTPCGCVLLSFVMVIMLPVIGWIGWSRHAARLLEDELAEIRAAGEPIEPADLAAFYVVPPGEADTTQLWVEAAEAFETASFSEAAKQLPIVGEGPDIPPIDEEWEQLEAVEAFLKEHQHGMDSIHEAAKLGGYARFDQDFEDGIAMLMPQIQELRTAARMLTLEARVAARRGDSQAVARSIHAIFATGRAAEEDPVLMSHLVRVALAGVAVGESEAAIGSVEFSDADLKMLREDVQSVNFQRGLERALMGDRVIAILTFRHPGRFAGTEMPMSWRANNEDLALYLSTLTKYVDASRQPFPRALTLSQQATDNVTAVLGGSRVNRLRYVFTSMLLPPVDVVFEATARGTGVNACADSALAIEQYRRKNRKLPKTLTELVPEFLAAVPVDPMDGKPLRYVVNDGGYLLYSVGQNGVDDGGIVGDERLDEVFTVRTREEN